MISLPSKYTESIAEEIFWNRSRLTALSIGVLLASWANKHAHASGLEIDELSGLSGITRLLYNASARMTSFLLDSGWVQMLSGL